MYKILSNKLQGRWLDRVDLPLISERFAIGDVDMREGLFRPGLPNAHGVRRPPVLQSIDIYTSRMACLARYEPIYDNGEYALRLTPMGSGSDDAAGTNFNARGMMAATARVDDVTQRTVPMR